MRNNPLLTIFVFSTIILIMDSYAWWGITKLIAGFRPLAKRMTTVLFWIVPVLLISGFSLILFLKRMIPGDRITAYLYLISGSFVVFYIPKLIFIIFNIFDDIIFPIRKMIVHRRQRKKIPVASAHSITRRTMLTQVGAVIAGLPILPLIYGIAYGRFDFTVRRKRLNFANLPLSFKGIKIVQISDFHIGTFVHHADEVERLIEMINSENPDLLLFTGDFINNLSLEMDPFIGILGRLQTHIGKYSILGNHDYGEYVRWDSEQQKQANVERLIKIQRDLGFDLLMDESRKIEIAGDKIELIGIQNWGLPPFPQYGDLDKALRHADKSTFKILLSHDPTHWDNQVLGKTDIDLTLSGHTHGAQFGFEIPGMRVSPAKIRYKRWGGLYTEGKQSLYVNTGLGSIGYPGRVGMPPEITVIELQSG